MARVEDALLAAGWSGATRRELSVLVHGAASSVSVALCTLQARGTARQVCHGRWRHRDAETDQPFKERLEAIADAARRRG